MSFEFPDCNTLDETAAMMHETYASLLRAGFTKHEALHIVTADGCCKQEEE